MKIEPNNTSAPVACNKGVLELKPRLCVSSAHSFLWFMPEQPHQLPLPPTLHILRRKRITQCSYILHGVLAVNRGWWMDIETSGLDTLLLVWWESWTQFYTYQWDTDQVNIVLFFVLCFYTFFHFKIGFIGIALFVWVWQAISAGPGLEMMMRMPGLCAPILTQEAAITVMMDTRHCHNWTNCHNC